MGDSPKAKSRLVRGVAFTLGPSPDIYTNGAKLARKGD